MRTLLFTLFILFGATSLVAQNYRTSLGVRLGQNISLTGKMFIDSQSAIEGIVNLQWRGAGVTGLYERHHMLMDVPELQVFYGFGGHIGYWNDEERNSPIFTEQSTVVAGFDGILGIEYTFDEIPLSLSLDWKPMFNLIGEDFRGYVGGGALSVRYVF